ncbi:hypothetical protein BX616_002346 [Lobosporangium transversale]|nr:hypothetical protein BX616_002346 [Lobosporangium transversale]
MQIDSSWEIPHLRKLMTTPQQHLEWAIEKAAGKEHVFFTTFVKRFKFTDKEYAKRAYMQLIQSRYLRQDRREKLLQSYQEFEKSNEETFWSKYMLDVMTRVTMNQTAASAQRAGSKLAAAKYDCAINNLRDSDIPETGQSTKGKRMFQDRSEGNDVLRRPNDESLNTNDMDDTQIAQKKSKIPRLRKSSLSAKPSTIDEPWRSLLEQLHNKIKGEKAECSEEWSKAVSGTHLNLYRFIEAKVSSPKTITKIVEKDIFVAMSGIVNARMEKARDIFGGDTINHIQKMCLRPTMQEPSTVLKEVLAPLAGAYRSGGLQELQEEVDILLGCEAKARRERASPNPLRHRVLDAIRHIATIKPSKDMSEAELVGVCGELTSKATKWQRRLLQKEMELELGSSLYGRKLDLQCRTVDHLEINNSEFKIDSKSDEQVEVQYRKNLRVNQAMMLYLRDQIGFQLQDLELLALDVRGLTARVFSLRYDQDVFITDLATMHLLRLPDSTASWKLFLSGETISVILAYAYALTLFLSYLQEHLMELTEKIDEQNLLHEQQMRVEARCTPEREPRGLGEFTFFSPSKKQRDCNLAQVLLTDSDIEDSDIGSEYDDLGESP